MSAIEWFHCSILRRFLECHLLMDECRLRCEVERVFRQFLRVFLSCCVFFRFPEFFFYSGFISTGFSSFASGFHQSAVIILTYAISYQHHLYKLYPLPSPGVTFAFVLRTMLERHPKPKNIVVIRMMCNIVTEQILDILLFDTYEYYIVSSDLSFWSVYFSLQFI